MARIELAGAAPVLALLPDDELETPPLPREHPKWVRDALAVSQRARRLIARLRPVIMHVLTFWDHHVRSIAVGGRRLSIDVSGSYRME
jgi:hypothetical protein